MRGGRHTATDRVAPLSGADFASHGSNNRNFPISLHVHLQRSAKRSGSLLSYSQAEPGRELTQPSPFSRALYTTVRGPTVRPSNKHFISPFRQGCFSDAYVLRHLVLRITSSLRYVVHAKFTPSSNAGVEINVIVS